MVLILVAKGQRRLGVEVDLDPKGIRSSKENAIPAGVAHRGRFFERNLFDMDVRRAT